MKKIFTCLVSLWLGAAAHGALGIIAGPITNAADGHIYYLLEAASWTNSEIAAVNPASGM